MSYPIDEVVSLLKNENETWSGRDYYLQEGDGRVLVMGCWNLLHERTGVVVKCSLVPIMTKIICPRISPQTIRQRYRLWKATKVCWWNLLRRAVADAGQKQ